MTEDKQADDKILWGAQLILEGLGVDLTDHNFANTPQRMLKVYKELFNHPLEEIPVFDEEYTSLVVMKHFEFVTLCPHHMLPVVIDGSIAYYPKGRVVGYSKLARIMLEANTCPMTQEKLTDTIMKRLTELVPTSSGSALILEGKHGCTAHRGIRSDCVMVTTKFQGVFEQDKELQMRFLGMVGGNGR
jgi:GTP cyclohydrolase I